MSRCDARSDHFPLAPWLLLFHHWLRKSPTLAITFDSIIDTVMAESDAAGTSYEEEHVHEVYEQIASHFSSTRYKVCVTPPSLATKPTNRFQPWPIVERFLKEQPDGAIGADVGCGNGKYLAVNKRVFIVGSDRYVVASSTCSAASA